MDHEGSLLRDEVLYTGAEASAILKVDRRTLAAWRAAGKLKVIRLSARCLRYRGADLRALLDQHEAR